MTRWVFSSLVSGALATAGIAGVPIAPDSVPDAYSYLYRATIEKGENDSKAIRAALPYISIEYRVTEGIFEVTDSGSCPYERSVEAVRTITFHRNGMAEFSGRDVDREGEFCSELSTYVYGRLCYALEGAGFFKMKSRYQSPFITMRTIEWTVTDIAGQEHKVSEYGNFGPPTLWLLANTVEVLARDLPWRDCD